MMTKTRIPKEAYQKLRHHGGGAHSTKKGAKGYTRSDNKRLLREAKKEEDMNDLHCNSFLKRRLFSLYKQREEWLNILK